ncbi:MAG: hypothetical protein RL660_2166 [Bacteroidota bacterium]
MNKLFLSIATVSILAIANTAIAQDAGVTRLKTNPLSPMVAAERNVNLSVERTFKGTKNVIGLQASAGYIFGWTAVENSDNLVSKPNVSGFVSTAELRTYFAKGFFAGAYIQGKSITANYTVDNYFPPAGGTITTLDVKSTKRATSAGVLAGYNFELTKKLGAELYGGFGLSNKQLRDNGRNVDRFDYLDNNEINLLIENSGRFPQFYFTYKLIYTL